MLADNLRKEDYLFWVILALFLLLIVFLFKLQIVEGEKYANIAEKI